MNLTELITDPYNRRSRLQPALLALLPIPLVALILFPGLESKLGTLIGIAGYLGGATWLTQVGRDRGRKLEPTLFTSWDGMPSVSLLRHRDSRISAITKQRYHASLAANVPNLTLPGAEEEATNPEAADDTYRSVTDWLLTATRGKPEFKLLFEENINYGFRRNFWALRPVALLVDLVLTVIVVALRTTFAPENRGTTIELNTTSLFALGVIIIHMMIVLAATKNWVRTPADAYGKQLLAACDTINGKGHIARDC
jgi:hypothetical protein|tara:strand:+ start:6456 stop:7220 length:765 start_codon:yes stop_codon:yes gene_type:complete